MFFPPPLPPPLCKHCRRCCSVKTLNPINFYCSPPLLLLDVFLNFVLERRRRRGGETGRASPAVREKFPLSLLIFPAPYGAADTSPAGCGSRPRVAPQPAHVLGLRLSFFVLFFFSFTPSRRICLSRSGTTAELRGGELEGVVGQLFSRPLAAT